MSLEDRIVQYVEWIGDAHVADKLLTPQQQSKFCIIFGDRVLGAYDTAQEAVRDQTTKYRVLATLLYAPHGRSAQSTDNKQSVSHE